MCSLCYFSTGNLYTPTAQSSPVCFSLVPDKGSILLTWEREYFYNFLYHKNSFYNRLFYERETFGPTAHRTVLLVTCEGCFSPVFIKETTFSRVFSCDYNLLFNCDSDFQQSCGLFKPASWSCKAQTVTWDVTVSTQWSKLWSNCSVRRDWIL